MQVGLGQDGEVGSRRLAPRRKNTFREGFSWGRGGLQEMGSREEEHFRESFSWGRGGLRGEGSTGDEVGEGGRAP